MFEIDGQRGENYAGTLENAIVAQFQPKALPIPCPNRTRNATDNTYQCPGNCTERRHEELRQNGPNCEH